MSTALNFAAMLRAERQKAAAPKKGETEIKTTNSSSSSTSPLTKIDLASVPLALSAHKIGSLENIYYFPNWLSEYQQSALINCIDEPDSATPWQSLTQRRLKMYGGVPTGASSGMLPTEMPTWLRHLLGTLENSDLLKARSLNLNHVLLNEYIDGRGIGAHKDGPLYHDCALALSLGVGALMRFFDKKGGEYTIYLQPGSLLAFTDSAYIDWWHEIATSPADPIDSRCLNRSFLSESHIGNNSDYEVPRGHRRLSLTVRSVKAVSMREALSTPEQKSELARRAQNFYQNVSETQYEDLNGQ